MDIDLEGDDLSTVAGIIVRQQTEIDTDIVNCIVQSNRIAEKKHRPSPLAIEQHQNEVNPQMRAILVDWLNEVAEEFGLKATTLFLAVNYMDRYLGCVCVSKRKLQLLGITCLLIAAKYEETIPPGLEDYVYITDNTYNKEEVRRMEVNVLNVLGFTLTAVTVPDFLGIYKHVAQAEHKVAFLAEYFCELTLQDYNFLQFSPSMIACSSLVLALFTFGLLTWSSVMEYYTDYKASDLNNCLREIHRIHSVASTSPLQAVREKYSKDCYYGVSALPATPQPPLFY